MATSLLMNLLVTRERSWDTGIESLYAGTLILMLAVVALRIGFRITTKTTLKGNDIRNRTQPPEIKSSIPWIGHAIGMLRHQWRYLEILRKFNPGPIYTFNFLTTPIHLIYSPPLIHSIFRSSSSFLFTPLLAVFTSRALGIDADSMSKILGPPPDGSRSEKNYLEEYHSYVAKALGPGSDLEMLAKRFMGGVVEELRGMGFCALGGRPNGEGGKWEVGKERDAKKIKLWEWTRKVVTLGMSGALYGPRNPLAKDATLVDALWTFEDSFPLLTPSPLLAPLIAPGALYARTRLNTAFRDYYSKGLESSAAEFVKLRAAAGDRWNLPLTTTADMEIGILFTATINSAPGTFWLLCYVLRDEALLSGVRKEVEGCVLRSRETCKEEKDGHATTECEGLLKDEWIMDLGALRKTCSLLTAAWEETLRLSSRAASVRVVARDTWVADATYLLRANSLVYMPAGVTHTAPEIWGEDALEFDAGRFLRGRGKGKLWRETVVEEKKKKSNGGDAEAGTGTWTKEERARRRLQTQSLIPFGGGPHLCPGRHFAFLEACAFVGFLVVAFDISPVLPAMDNNDLKSNSKSKGFQVPAMMAQGIGHGIAGPVEDVEVVLSPREGWGAGQGWRFVFGCEEEVK